MKKILMIMFCMFALSSYAETYTYKTTAFAYKYLNDYGRWTNWSDWEPSDMLLTIDFSDDVVKIYSPEIQIYCITEYVRNYTDSNGGKQIEFRFIDQDYDKGTMRLRIERNGNSQLYIDFANVMWVYNVRRIC